VKPKTSTKTSGNSAPKRTTGSAKVDASAN
jgi:hypothetical protein